jgi:hypothetical protein
MLLCPHENPDLGKHEREPRATELCGIESPVEMLVLDASGKLIVHNSVTDTADPARLQRYAASKDEVSSLKDKENGRQPGDDSMFQRSAPGRGGRRDGGP